MHLQRENNMTTYGLDCRKTLVGTGWSILSSLAYLNGLRNKPFHLVRPLFPASRVCFLATQDWHFLGALFESLLSGGCG